MNQYTVETTDIIPAAPEKVYTVLSDYHTHHPAILPKPAFKGVKVIKGGKGAGTELQAITNEWGREVVYNLKVSEPEPGRVLFEEDAQKGIATTFKVEPINGGHSRVTISMKRNVVSGWRGALEKAVNPPLLQMVFKTELKQIADYVKSHPAL
ncbi:MAG: hypothetical protein Fur0022_19730 [Anaerolineales bacterium]